MKIALMVNPRAGGKKGAKALPVVEKLLCRNNIEYDAFISRHHQHLIHMSSELDTEKYDAIVAMGGDGTNFQMLNGLVSTYLPEKIPPLGIIPVGAGNSFAIDLNIGNIEEGIRSVLEYKHKWIDVCSFCQKEKTIYFVNLTGIGFVTHVAESAHKLKWMGDLSYVMGIFHRIITLCFHDLELEIDGRVLKGPFCFAEFCNSRFTGGQMLMAPNARIDDGLMDVVLVKKLSRTSLLWTLPKIYSGNHILHPAVHYMQAKQVKIRTSKRMGLLPDGEIVGEAPTTITIHPKMIRYLS